MDINIVRAWKDELYRKSLSDAEQAALPENPVGELELVDGELETVSGGHDGEHNSMHHEHCPHYSYRSHECPSYYPYACRNSYYDRACHHYSYSFCQEHHHNER